MAKPEGPWAALGRLLGVGVVAVLACGCGARAALVGAGGDEGAGETAEAVKCSGCPYDEVVTAANYAPPHAFPGPCYGPGDPSQAEWDGATAELEQSCRSYCGQSYPECGEAAQLVDLRCIDRDIGHRWGAYCICG